MQTPIPAVAHTTRSFLAGYASTGTVAAAR
jgi:hypothetical protein